MTPEQRYQLDTFGFLHIKGALSAEELHAAQVSSGRYITAAMTQRDALPPGFRQDPKDGRRFENGFAFDRSLERLVTHRAIWPIVVELTGGRPHFSSGTLQVDRQDIYAAGLSLHCGREDVKSYSYEFMSTNGEEIRCNDFVFFPYLDDVEPGDGGLVVLPGSREEHAEVFHACSNNCTAAAYFTLCVRPHTASTLRCVCTDKAQFPRPMDMFGAFSAAQRHKSKGEDALQVPKHTGSDLPVLPLGMLNITAKAGTRASTQRTSTGQDTLRIASIVLCELSCAVRARQGTFS